MINATTLNNFDNNKCQRYFSSVRLVKGLNILKIISNVRLKQLSLDAENYKQVNSLN